MSVDWSIHNPVRIVFGNQSLDRLGDCVGDRRVGLVLDQKSSAALQDRIVSQLNACLSAVFMAPAGEADLADLADLHGAITSSRADVQALIAIGSASTIDLAKLLSLGTPAGQFDGLARHIRGEAEFEPSDCLAVIAVPTMAAGGSEVSSWVRILQSDAHDTQALQTRWLNRDDLWPEVAVVDPLLTLECSQQDSLSGGLEALANAFESIWNHSANPYSDALAVQAARAIVTALPRVLDTPTDRRARAAMSRAALLSGLAFAQTRTALAHALSVEAMQHRKISRGIACSFCLPEVWRRARACSAERDAVLAQVIPKGERDGPAWLESWLRSVGVSTHFADHGLPGAERVIEQALISPKGRNFIGAVV